MVGLQSLLGLQLKSLPDNFITITKQFALQQTINVSYNYRFILTNFLEVIAMPDTLTCFTLYTTLMCQSWGFRYRFIYIYGLLYIHPNEAVSMWQWHVRGIGMQY